MLKTEWALEICMLNSNSNAFNKISSLLLQVCKSFQISAGPGSNSFPLFLNYGWHYQYAIQCLIFQEQEAIVKKVFVLILKSSLILFASIPHLLKKAV